MLVRDPVSCAGDEVEVAARSVAKDVLERRFLRRIGGDTCHVKAQLFAVFLCDKNRITYMDVTQVPERRGQSSGTVEVAVDNRAAPVAGARAIAVPSGISPRILGGGRHVATGERSHLLDRGVHPDGGNAQTYWLRAVDRCPCGCYGRCAGDTWANSLRRLN